MPIGKILEAVNHYADWEFASFVIAAIWRQLSKSSEPDELSQASHDGSMYLTAQGWKTDKLRWRTNSPIRPDLW